MRTKARTLSIGTISEGTLVPRDILHEHDGACFGVWAYVPDDGEIPRVDDPSALDTLPRDTSEALYVNDHGNVTLYARNGRAEWRSVWSVV